MPEIPKEVQDVVRGVNVTIVDLIGALLPGLVWFVLLATAVSLATTPGSISPISSINGLLERGSDDGLAFYSGVVLVSILLGWVIKVSVIDAADRLCASSIWLAHRLWHHWLDVRSKQRHELKVRICKHTDLDHCRVSDVRFPYNTIVRKEYGEVFQAVTELATDRLGGPAMRAPGQQPFDGCKLALRRLDPGCRDDADRVEAQVALLGSLFIASLFSLVLAIAVRFFGQPWSWRWIAPSVIAAAFLGYTFRKDRRAEVTKIYLMALFVAERESEKELEHSTLERTQEPGPSAVRRSHSAD